MVIGEIAQRIQLMRDQRVVLDTDLAAFYGETTKRFNQQVNRNRGRRYAPLAFTEHGAIMASMVLNSQRATAPSVYVVRAFVELRGMLASNQALANKVQSLERKVSTHERNIADLADSMAQLLHTPPDPPKRSIGFITHEDKPGKPASTKAKAAGK